MSRIFGIFSNPNDPGPGVSKNEPNKPRFFIFTDIFTRKFSKLVLVNLMYFVFNLPAIIIAFLMSSHVVNLIFSTETIKNNGLFSMSLSLFIASVFVCFPVVTIGPAQAGLTYIMRNFAREEHAFLWSDFKEHALKNLKQSLITCLINFILIAVFIIDVMWFKDQKSTISLLGSGIMYIFILLFFMMNLYIYPMMITFELSIKQLYKNAFIFSMFKFFNNLATLLICLLIQALLFLIFPFVGAILFLLLSFSLISLIINFRVYPTIKKHMLDKVEDKKTDSDNNDNQKIFDEK
jgi:uncharacterized membrane protein YesL